MNFFRFEEIKEDPKWKHSITLSLLTENNHPSSKFAFGNQASLEDKDLTKKLTKFYNDYYSLSKIKIVTLCDNDSSKQFLDLMKIFLKINRKISSKASRATYFQPPYLEKNKLVMIKSEKKETVIITKYLKVNQSNDFSFLHFLLFIIDRALDEKMIKRELLAEDVVSYFEIYDNYVALHAKIDVSLKGRKKLQPILDVYNQVITGIGKLLTKEVYQRVRKEQYTRMMFRNRLDSNADFADELLNNFQNFDIDFLFSGDLELQEEFDGVALRSILGEIKSSKTIVTVLGDFRLSPHLEKVENKAKRRVLGSSKRGKNYFKLKIANRSLKKGHTSFHEKIKRSHYFTVLIGKTGHNLFNRKESKKKEEEKKKLKPVWPTVSQSEVLNNARIAGSFKIEDLLKGRLVDFSFLGATRINGRADILGQVELGFRHPAFGVEFGYIDFPGEISKSIDAGFMQYRKNIFEYSQENFDAVEKEFSDKVRDQLSQKPLTKVSQSLITIANTKDPLHEVTIFVELYLEKSPTKEENCNLEIISQAWRARLRLVNQDLSSLVSNIEIKPKNGMLIVKIDTMIEILHPVLATFMQEIFGTPQLSRDETDRALDNEYNRITNYEDLFMQTAAMLRSHLLSKHKFLRKEKLAHMRKIAKKDLQTPKFRVGRLFLEGYILPQVTQKVITDLAQKIDQKYNEKKEFNISPFKTWLDVPTTPTVIAFPTQNQDQELKPFGHFYHLQHSYNYKELAKVWTLQKILGELSNKLLVKKHNLNTVLKVGMLEIENDHVFLYLWAETKDVKKTSSLLENFYREAEGEFLKLNKQKINEHLLNLKDELNEIPPSLIKHAERDYDFINYGLYEEFVKNIVSEMFTTITKEVLLDKFKEIFMQSAGSKIVIDGSYSREQIENDKVGLHNYNINDAYNKQKKYSVVKIPD